MSSIFARLLIPLVLLAACAEPQNNTCFSTANLSAEQTAWFVEAAEDWNWYEGREAITVDPGCTKVRFASLGKRWEIYNGHTIIFDSDTKWSRCYVSGPFLTIAGHGMGHALDYPHSDDPNSIMFSAPRICGTALTNPPN